MMIPDATEEECQWLAKGLTVIRDRSALVGTCCFELAFSNSESRPQSRGDGSLYLPDTGFDLLHVAFLNADPGFDYYDDNRFDARKTTKLIRKLSVWEAEVSAARDCGILAKTFAANYRVENLWGRFPWLDLQRQIGQASKEVREFIERGQSSHRFLWILGL